MCLDLGFPTLAQVSLEKSLSTNALIGYFPLNIVYIDFFKQQSTVFLAYFFLPHIILAFSCSLKATILQLQP